MKSLLLSGLLIAMSCLSNSQTLPDYFPMKIGNQWRYSYKSTEKKYLDISFMNALTIDSGSVQYKLVSVIGQDSVNVWSIEEIDSIKRHTHDYFHNTDTAYLIKATIVFKLYEYLDSLHSISSVSYFPPLIFPVQWAEGRSGGSIFRYGSDSSFKFLHETQSIGGSTWSFEDSLLFQRNVGLTSAKSTTSKGPNTPYFFKWEATLTSMVTGVTLLETTVLKQFSLFYNYPNPFNPTTIISFELPQKSYVTITIYDALGREMEKLVDSYLESGMHAVAWSAIDYSSGVYFCKLSTVNLTQTIKLLLTR